MQTVCLRNKPIYFFAVPFLPGGAPRGRVNFWLSRRGPFFRKTPPLLNRPAELPCHPYILLVSLLFFSYLASPLRHYEYYYRSCSVSEIYKSSLRDRSMIISRKVHNVSAVVQWLGFAVQRVAEIPALYWSMDWRFNLCYPNDRVFFAYLVTFQHNASRRSENIPPRATRASELNKKVTRMNFSFSMWRPAWLSYKIISY